MALSSSTPRSTRADANTLFAITLLLLYIVLIVLVWPGDTAGGLLTELPLELRYFIVVAAGAALGATLIAATVKGRAAPKTDWAPIRDTLQPVFASLLGAGFYTVVRGALLRPEPSSVACLNPYGLLAASVVIGLFAGPTLASLHRVAEAVGGHEPQVKAQLDSIATAIGITTLDNYSGFVAAAFRDPATAREVSYHEQRVMLGPFAEYDLVVWFQRTLPERGVEIRVTGGNDVDFVEFSVSPESDNVVLRPHSQTVSVPIANESDRAQFRFRSPEAVGMFDIWIEVSQKNRLIHSFSIPAVVLSERSAR